MVILNYDGDDGNGGGDDGSHSLGDWVLSSSPLPSLIRWPGHTAGCLTYVLRGPDDPKAAFTGDTLLVRSCGRTDFAEGQLRCPWHIQRLHQLHHRRSGRLLHPCW